MWDERTSEKPNTVDAPGFPDTATADASSAAASAASAWDPFYITGGTIPLDADSYVVRRADTQLLGGLRRGEFCYVLNTRQMGKSSLMVRTARRLREDGCRVAILDLTAIGQNLTVDQWYYGLLTRTAAQTRSTAPMLAFWKANRELGPMQRFVEAVRHVLLEGGDRPDTAGTAAPATTIPAPPRGEVRAGRADSVDPAGSAGSAGSHSHDRLVIFVDEIDVVRSLPFSVDEFFAGIRECYNRRPQDLVFERLTFCLLGVAAPSDLVQDTRISPFNIGTRIELGDFTPEEASRLARGLLPNRGIDDGALSTQIARRLLRRVLFWTGGHPYMTQRLCRAVAQEVRGGGPVAASYLLSADGRVDRACRELFLTRRALESDDNLTFVRNRLLHSEADTVALLDLYRAVRRSRWGIENDAANPLCSLLQLSGIAALSHERQDRLICRNRIYERVFDDVWIAEHLPGAELRRQRAAYRRGVVRTALLASAIVAVVSTLAALAIVNAARARASAALARQSAEDKRHTLYDAQIDQAASALQSGQMARARELLAELKPKPGETDLREFAWKMLDGRVRDQSQFTYRGASDPMWDVAVSRDGRFLAASDSGQQIYVWDVRTHQRLSCFRIPLAAQFVMFSPDGRYLLTNNNFGYLRHLSVWDWRAAATASPPRSVRELPYGQAMTWPRYSPDGRTLACADITQRRSVGSGNSAQDAGPVVLLRADDYTVLKTIAGISPARNLAYTADGRALFVARCNGWVQEYQAVPPYREIGRACFIPPNPPSKSPDAYKLWGMRVSPDGRTIAIVNANLDLTLWDWPTRKLIGKIERNVVPYPGFLFTPDSKCLVTAEDDGTARLWDTRTCSQVAVLYGHTAPVPQLALSSDGRTLFTASSDGTVRQWDLDAARRQADAADAPDRSLPTNNLVAWQSSARDNLLGRSNDQTLTIRRVASDPHAVQIDDLVTKKTTLLRDPSLFLSTSDTARPEFSSDDRCLWALYQPTPSQSGGPNQTASGLVVKRWYWRRGIADVHLTLPPVLAATWSALLGARDNVVVYIDPKNRIHWLDALTGRDAVPAQQLPRRPSAILAEDAWHEYGLPDTYADIIVRLPKAPGSNGSIDIWELMADRRHLLHYSQDEQTNVADLDFVDCATAQVHRMMHQPVDASETTAETMDRRMLVIHPGVGQKVFLRFALVGDVSRALPPVALTTRMNPGVLREVLQHPSGSAEPLLFLMSPEGEISLMDPATGENKASLRGLQQFTMDADLSPDGRTAATVGFDQKLCLWDLTTQRLMTAIPLGFTPVKVRFSQRGDLLTVVDAHQNLTIFHGGQDGSGIQ